ncbi:phenylacetyl-ligase [Grosmannia clavigera kw1407]|uniref:Phenylacetyl-ligase n=1 Tax=Grosmannia clavigera (strain kw1407 / UAMH 11150) TaxID=655863 RepID=F0XH60_GROCL|nr:phenylacetyl-ligase [Grosmannia clavigera kw1407]EFX02856.1 phenylacetyl-ligase [Grosmannia clavigera kw1407]
MPHTSPYPPVPIPEVDIWTLVFERKAKAFTDSKEIITDGDSDRSYSFGELRSAALAFGRGLQELWGWKHGDVLAFYTPNCIDTPPATLGLLWAGGIATPANPLYTEKELTFQLRDAGASAIVTQLSFLETARRAAKAVGIPDERIILVGDKQDPSGTFRHFNDFVSVGSPGRGRSTSTVAIDPRRDLAFLVYSSGTTGLPKGVCLTHHNIVANVLQFCAMDGPYFHPHGGHDGKGDKGLGVSPFFHIYGLVCNMLVFVYMGWQLVVMSRFDMERACQLIEKHKVTFAYFPPPIILAFSKHPVVDQYDVTSIRLFHSGGAPLTTELATALWDRLKIPVKQGYGLSETSSLSHMQTPDEWGKFMGSVGKLAPNMEAKIVDPDSELEVADGETGELWLKGPNVFTQYLNLPENTRATMSSCGYFKTGDIFRRDKHGNYYCVDRLKELIKYKAFQVAPAELEGVLLGHDDILDVGVIGIEDRAQATEVPRAYVVLKPGHARSADKAAEIVAWPAGHTAPHKKLRGGVHFVDSIPKSASGKILRRVLRGRALEKAGSVAKL